MSPIRKYLCPLIVLSNTLALGMVIGQINGLGRVGNWIIAKAEAAPAPASAKNTKVPPDIAIRIEEERRFAITEEKNLYSQAARDRAEEYKKRAKYIASIRGNPKPVLDAADNYEKEAIAAQ
jgi:hypothetical protein